MIQGNNTEGPNETLDRRIQGIDNYVHYELCHTLICLKQYMKTSTKYYFKIYTSH
jgi:hypothetical protein